MRVIRPVALVLVAILVIPGTTSAGSPDPISYESQGVKTVALLYHPLEELKKPVPGILVLHGAGGYSQHEKNVATKLANQGYIAMTMAYTPPVDGPALFKDEARLRKLERFIVDSAQVLLTQPGVDKDRLAAIGYSLGGYFTQFLLSGSQDIKFRAGVIYYGVFDMPASWGELRAPLLVLQGDRDKYVNFLPRTRELAKRSKTVELVVYPRTTHQFDFDYLRDRYDPGAADDAWKRTLAFFEKHLKK